LAFPICSKELHAAHSATYNLEQSTTSESTTISNYEVEQSHATITLEPLLLTALLIGLLIPVAVAAQASDEVTPEVQQLYAQAKAARQHGDDATAIAKYKTILKLAPHLAAAYNNLE